MLVSSSKSNRSVSVVSPAGIVGFDASSRFWGGSVSLACGRGACEGVGATASML